MRGKADISHPTISTSQYYFFNMGRSRSLTRLGSLLKRAASGAPEAQASGSSAVTNAASYVSKRGFNSTPFRTNVLGGQYCISPLLF